MAFDHPQKIQVPQVRFVGEQDGPPERELKGKLVEFFGRDKSVRAAYLARVMFGEVTNINVALCVRTQFGSDPGLADKVGRIFASMFGAHEHMDIVFLNEQQEAQLTKVCAAFFNASNARPEQSKE